MLTGFLTHPVELPKGIPDELTGILQTERFRGDLLDFAIDCHCLILPNSDYLSGVSL